jgi:hypothetical protein
MDTVVAIFHSIRCVDFILVTLKAKLRGERSSIQILQYCPSQYPFSPCNKGFGRWHDILNITTEHQKGQIDSQLSDVLNFYNQVNLCDYTVESPKRL